jgi:hypothetical protein
MKSPEKGPIKRSRSGQQGRRGSPINYAPLIGWGTANLWFTKLN